MVADLIDEGIGHQRARRFDEAVDCYARAIEILPECGDAWRRLGVLSLESGDPAAARSLLERAIRVKPEDLSAQRFLAELDASEAKTRLVTALTSTERDATRTPRGDVAESLSAYETAVAAAPDCAEAQHNLGNRYRQSGRPQDALRAYAAAIQAKPDFAAAYCGLAAVLLDLKQFAVAIRALEAVLRLVPDMPDAHAMLGQAYRQSGRYREAADATRRALELRPDRNAYVNYSVAAHAAGAFGDALDATLRALELDPSCVEAHNNRAILSHESGRYAQAAAASEAAIAMQPDNAEAHVNLALALLVQGDFARGWDEYAWTWRLPNRRTAYPYIRHAALWNGEAFAGQRLLITHDQGLGDTIQMARYLPAVKALGGRVVLEVAPELESLFEDLPGADELRRVRDVAVDEEDVDVRVPVSGLPRAFGTDLRSIPAAVPYLRARAERVEHWRPRLASPAPLRVGIVWAGNPEHQNDHRRSCALEDFTALAAVEGVAFFGLQKGRDEARRSCGSLTLDPLGAELGDFADTAAVLEHLDLVIAVDTAIVHLAGAMAKPVWTLLPFAGDWRWLTDRTDSPWYPTMRLFRQPRAGDWAAVFAAVVRELRALRAGKLA